MEFNEDLFRLPTMSGGAKYLITTVNELRKTAADKVLDILSKPVAIVESGEPSEKDSLEGTTVKAVNGQAVLAILEETTRPSIQEKLFKLNEDKKELTLSGMIPSQALFFAIFYTIFFLGVVYDNIEANLNDASFEQRYKYVQSIVQNRVTKKNFLDKHYNAIKTYFESLSKYNASGKTFDEFLRLLASEPDYLLSVFSQENPIVGISAENVMTVRGYEGMNAEHSEESANAARAASNQKPADVYSHSVDQMRPAVNLGDKTQSEKQATTAAATTATTATETAAAATAAAAPDKAQNIHLEPLQRMELPQNTKPQGTPATAVPTTPAATAATAANAAAAANAEAAANNEISSTETRVPRQTRKSWKNVGLDDPAWLRQMATNSGKRVTRKNKAGKNLSVGNLVTVRNGRATFEGRVEKQGPTSFGKETTQIRQHKLGSRIELLKKRPIVKQSGSITKIEELEGINEQNNTETVA
jgi:hypothetical protein